MRLLNLVGNARLKSQLEYRGQLPHAVILSGPEGTGRHTLARQMAQAMLCQGNVPEEARPCGVCPHCRKVLAGIHPDFISLTSFMTAEEQGKDIRVSAVRALRQDAFIRPNEGRRKVYLLERAETMNASGQNSLLKLLEDGPAYAAFLLITVRAEGLLPTVRSRCEQFALTPVSREEARDCLARLRPDVPTEMLEQAAAACNGSVGVGLRLLDSGGDNGLRRSAEELMSALASRDEWTILSTAVGMERLEREELPELYGLCAGLAAEALLSPSAQTVGWKRDLAPKELLMLRDKLEEYRLQCKFHVGTGHSLGRAASELCEMLRN